MTARSETKDESGQRDSVRRYFATLSLRAKPDAWTLGWSQLPVEQFFVALQAPPRSINVERRPCSEQIESLATVFGSVRWV